MPLDSTPAEAAVLSVINERFRQDAKWGQQDHDAGTWALILLEEIGEWAKAELHARFGGPDAKNAHTEAIHMTAVAMAIIECMNRKTAASQSSAVKAVMDDEYVIEQAAEMAKADGGIHAAALQRRLQIAYVQAARCVNTMQERGIISTTQLVAPWGYKYIGP
jgi:DNA segregation ATPase FtsK/SpoIIIE-like protein